MHVHTGGLHDGTNCENYNYVAPSMGTLPQTLEYRRGSHLTWIARFSIFDPGL